MSPVIWGSRHQNVVSDDDCALSEQATALQEEQVLQVNCLLMINQDVVHCSDPTLVQLLQLIGIVWSVFAELLANIVHCQVLEAACLVSVKIPTLAILGQQYHAVSFVNMDC